MKALLIVDMQRDFMPGGALPVPKGDQIIPIINAKMDHFQHIVASKDWHPKEHISFQGTWPPHCIQETSGAMFAEGLKNDRIEKVVYKGIHIDKDAYSAFSGTDLHEHLQGLKVNELYVVGVATDVCVLHTVLDALELGYKVSVIKEAVRGIDEKSDALNLMQSKGAKIVSGS